MNKIEETLWKDYDKVTHLIESSEVGTAEYKELVQEREKIMDDLVKLEQIDSEANVKALQIKSEDKREKIRNIITIGTFGANLILMICTIKKTFDFDKVSTVTSTVGRKMLNEVVPKLFKR